MTARVPVVAAVAAYRPGRRRWAGWVAREPALAGLSWEGLQAALWDRTVDLDRKDDLLAALVRTARWDRDALAALAALLRPGLAAEARRLVPVVGPTDAWAEIVAGLCTRVLSYDLDRRPRRIARNLILDALRPLRRAVRDHLRHSETTCEPTEGHHRPVEPEGLPAHTILHLAATAGVIAPVDVALITATRLSGLTIREAAGLLAMNLELAKKRRQRAEAALIAWWHDDTPPEPRRPATLAPVIALRPPAHHRRPASPGRPPAPGNPPSGNQAGPG